MMKTTIIILMFVPLLTYGILTLSELISDISYWRLLKKSEISQLILKILLLVAGISLFSYLVWAIEAHPDFLEFSNSWISYVIIYMIEIYWMPCVCIFENVFEKKKLDFSVFVYPKWMILTYTGRITWAIFLSWLGAGYTKNVQLEILVWLAIPAWALINPAVIFMFVISAMVAVVKVIMLFL